MTAHTRAPWIIHDQGLSTVEVRCPRDILIAEVGNCGTEDWANARLIAAAPDLLAALRLLVIACTEDVAPDGYTTLGAPDRASMRNAHTAIDKATRGLYDNWSVEEEQLQERRAHACDR